MPKPHALSPLFTTPALTAGTGVSILATLYPATANILDSQHPHLNCVDPIDGTLTVYNSTDVTAVGNYLVGQGISRCVFDWELPDTPANRTAVQNILGGLRATGLRCDLWDVDVTNADLADWKVANSDDSVHCVSYPLRNDSALWLSNTGPYVAAAKARYPTKPLWLWIAPKSTGYPPGPPTPPPWGTYSEAALRTYLSFGRDTASVAAVVVWWAPSAAGATGPWDGAEAWWQVVKEYAGGLVPVNVPRMIYNAVWAALEAGAETPALVLPGNQLDQQSQQYWERQRTRLAPVDFPHFRVDVGDEFVDSGYTGDDSYATAKADFLTVATGALAREKVESVRIIVTDKLIPKYDVNVLLNLREAMIRDLIRAAPNIGIGTLTVQRVGPFSGNITDGFVRNSDPPIPAKILTIRYPVTTIQELRDSLV